MITGRELGPNEAERLPLDNAEGLPDILKGVQVFFANTAARLIAVSATEITAIAPFDLEGTTETSIRVIRDGQESQAVVVPVIPASPAVFTADGSGKGQAMIVNADGTANSTGAPAAPGESITLFVTGLGQTDPVSNDGAILGEGYHFAKTITASIDGKTSEVTGAGGVSGKVAGFSQVVVMVPPLPFRGSYRLALTVDGVTSQENVTLAVSGPELPVPEPPTDVKVALVNATDVQLSWTVPDSLARSYRIERRIASEAEFSLLQVVATSLLPRMTLTFVDKTVSIGTKYDYRIRGENAFAVSTYSPVVSAVIPNLPPTPTPTDFRVTADGPASLRLTWSATGQITGIVIERRSSEPNFAVATRVPTALAAYVDSGLSPSTVYIYRLRAEGPAGNSGYTPEFRISTPALQPPPAPTLSASAIAATQASLSWTSNASDIIRFRIERRIQKGAYVEIAQPTAGLRAHLDTGLQDSSQYSYRVRVETGTGLSSFSNEVIVTTGQASPAAPTNLSGVSSSSTQVTLTWTNNSPTATTIRIERRASSSTNFVDLGPASSMTSATVGNGQPNTAYNFRIRAQNGSAYSGYSNEVTVTTLPVPIAVFLVHGLNQSNEDMKGLADNLQSSYGLTPGRFTVDRGFRFDDCVTAGQWAVCPSTCTIPAGAQRLAQHIVNANPPGDIVVVGYSLGGLIARDMIANNRVVLNGRKINLVTIGTPNLGYPYLAPDIVPFCSAIVSAMKGDWRTQPGTIVLSPYLLSLTNQWSAQGFPGNGRLWFAASGRAVSEPSRLGIGCRDQNPYSDGVVCQDSAAYNVTTSIGTVPNRYWSDPSQVYVHSYSGFTSLILGNTSDRTRYLPLWDPPPGGALFITLCAILNGLSQ